jgi:zinc protease
MKKVTLDDAKKFHDQFYGANYGVFAVVGPVDPNTVKAAAQELLGNWNTSMAYKPIIAAYKPVPAINRKIETPDKANAQFEAGVRVKLSEDDPDYPAMVLAGYLFGGPITSHISDRIRNREGLSYGANARLTVPTEGDSSLLSGTVSLNPANGPKVEFSFKDELVRTLKDGFTEQEVTEAKKAYLESRLAGRSQDAALLANLASHEQLNRTMKWDEQLETRIQSLTAQQISDAFRKHVDAASLTIVKAGDWKAANVYQ